MYYPPEHHAQNTDPNLEHEFIIKGDIWRAGVLLVFIATGKPTYKPTDSVEIPISEIIKREMVSEKNQSFEILPGRSKELNQLALKMLSYLSIKGYFIH